MKYVKNKTPRNGSFILLKTRNIVFSVHENHDRDHGQNLQNL